MNTPVTFVLLQTLYWSAAGYGVQLADGREFVHVRMYRGLQQTWEGWSKNSFLSAGRRLSNVMLLVDRPGYSVPRAEVPLPAGRSVQKPLYGTPLGTVAGTVVDEDKRPVAAAHVTTRAGSREAMMTMIFGRGAARGAFSGPDGRFVARNVGEGDVVVEANKKGFPPAHTAAMRVNPGEKKSGVVLTIPRGVAFSGRVLDKNGKPVSGAAVELSESTNDQGGMMRRLVASATCVACWRTSANVMRLNGADPFG